MLSLFKKQLQKIKYLPVCWYGVCVLEFGGSWSDFPSAIGKVNDLIVLALEASGLVAVIIIVYGGYTFITSAGNPEGVEKGQKLITNAIIGLIIVAVARLILGFIIEKLL